MQIIKQDTEVHTEARTPRSECPSSMGRAPGAQALKEEHRLKNQIFPPKLPSRRLSNEITNVRKHLAIHQNPDAPKKGDRIRWKNSANL